MLRDYYELDPHGDVELVLEGHSYPHKTLDDPLPPAERDDSQSDPAPPPQSDEAPAEPVEEPADERTASVGSSARPRGRKMRKSNSGEIRMRVSSKHLSLASSHFDRMF